MSLMPKAAIEKVANNDSSYTKMEFKDHSVFQMKNDEYTNLLAEALKTNTTLKELCLDKCQVTDVGCVALSFALRTQKGLEKLHLPNNKIGSVGLTAIAEMLQTNDTIVEINLFGNQRFGDPAVMALVDALERSNITLSKMIWRMDNTKGLAWKLTKMLSRNVEIGRRKAQGASFDDLDPTKNGGPSNPNSGASSPNPERRSPSTSQTDLSLSPSSSPAAGRPRTARHTVSVSGAQQKEVLGMISANSDSQLRSSWTPTKPSTQSSVPAVSTTPPSASDDTKPAEDEAKEDSPANEASPAKEASPAEESTAAKPAEAPKAAANSVSANGKTYTLTEKQVAALATLKTHCSENFEDLQAKILDAFA